MPTRITRFTNYDGTVDWYTFGYLQDWKDNFGDVVPRTNRLPGVHGGFDEFGSLAAPAEIGNVQVNFGLVAETMAAMSAQLNAVRKLARYPKGRLYMQMADGNERWCWARLQNVSTPHNLNKHTDLFHRVGATFQVADPHWYGWGRTTPTTGAVSSAWDSAAWGAPWSQAPEEWALVGVSNDVTVAYVGTAPVRPVLRVTVPAGESAEDVTIQRIVDSVAVDEVAYVGTLAATEYLEIDAWEYSVDYDGANGFDANFSYQRSRWFLLEPGANTVRVLMANAGDEVTLRVGHYDAFV